MKFYFHAGETTRDKRVSENLYDAVLLNTTRIGPYPLRALWSPKDQG